MSEFEVWKSPSNELALTNCVALHPEDVKSINQGRDNDDDKNKIYVSVSFEGKTYVFVAVKSPKMKRFTIGISDRQRRWIGCAITTKVAVTLHDQPKMFMASMNVELGFHPIKNTTTDAYDTDKLLKFVQESFLLLPFSVGQELLLDFQDKPRLLMVVTEVQVSDANALAKNTGVSQNANIGILTSDTEIIFDKKKESTLTLSGKARGKSAAIINPDWDLFKMGIGGLDNEFSGIFRRAFASRVFPPDLIKRLGIQHVKGILLYGPPGTGKTLMARQIGKMLNAREPKIVNGPEILNKYVGESEANIRKLFEEAEEEQKTSGANSGLHIIIFDEIDAICKQRGTVSGGTGVSDSVVSQLLSKIDGVDQLNNVLIIGMTNRKDLIDDALLRPGRLEVQMEISLPDEKGRLQILNIHTATLREQHKLDSEVDLKDLASRTKNYSGAELAGLVRAATTTAMNKLINANSTTMLDEGASDKLKVATEDFHHAIENDIKPTFGQAIDESKRYLGTGLIMYGDCMHRIIGDGELLIQQTRDGGLMFPVSVLLEGMDGSGKTAIAAHLAYELSEFPFVKVVSQENMIGYSENARCQAIKKIFDDAYKSELSCIIVDDIERLIDYVPTGPRFSNAVLQTLIVFLKRKLRNDRKLLIIGTSSCRDVLEQMQMLPAFNTVIHVPAVMNVTHLKSILNGYSNGDRFLFTPEDFSRIESDLRDKDDETKSKNICISVKKLLSLAEMAAQTGENERVSKFLSLLGEQCGFI